MQENFEHDCDKESDYNIEVREEDSDTEQDVDCVDENFLQSNWIGELIKW